MKLKMIPLNAFGVVILAASARASEVAFEYTVDVPDSPLGLSYSGSISGNLATVVISVNGIPEGQLVVGLISTGATPFQMYTSNGSLFFNSAGLGTSQGYAAPDNAQDSGFLGLGYTGLDSEWGGIDANMWDWATTGEHCFGSQCIPAFWFDPHDFEGDLVPGGTVDILRVTWDISDASNAAHGAFNFALAAPLNGSDEYYFAWTASVPAPGALTLLGLAGLVGAHRRRA